MRSSKPSAYEIEEHDVLDENIHEWEDYFRIDVGSRYMRDIELGRKLKQQSVEMFVDLFQIWRESKTSFDEDLALEIHDGAKAYIDLYCKFATRLAEGDFQALFDSSTSSRIVESLLQCLPKEMSVEQKMNCVKTFFCSSHFSEIPYQWVSTRIYATLRNMVKLGAYKNRESALQRFSSFFQDVSHISTYAPYCDGFVMDKQMASLMSNPHIALEDRYKVKIFSMNNWDQLFAWLDSLESGITRMHRAGLANAYPDRNAN